MSRKKTMLVIDDEASICLAFQTFFQRRGWRVETAAFAEEGLRIYDEIAPDVVFLDVRLPDQNGLEVLKTLTSRGAKVVMITAYGGLDTVVQSLHGNAFDYLVKPIDLDKALSLAERILEIREVPEGQTAAAQGADLLVGQSPAMQNVYKLIARAAAADSPVLIQGETGTGKELAAIAIHQFSERRDGPFVAINCGAIPEQLIESELFGHVKGAFTGADADRQGKFELAGGGSLLLDEIGELPLAMQVKLLRVLDSGVIESVGSSKTVQVNTRILAATNKDLRQEVQAGRFRQDLYYRLSVLNILMPPLRDRRDDIPLLAEHFLRQQTSDGMRGNMQIDAEVLRVLTQYPWPGNVRELRNAVSHALAVAPDRSLQVRDLPETILAVEDIERRPDKLSQATLEYLTRLPDDVTDRHREIVDQVEMAMIRYAMDRFDSNQTEAADYLGLHRNTLRKKLRQFKFHCS